MSRANADPAVRSVRTGAARNVSDHRRNQLGHIRRAASVVELRIRIARGLRVLPSALTIALGVAAGTLAVRKVFPDALGNRRAWEILAGAAAFVLASVAVAMLRRLPPRAGAVALDRHHRLQGRLTNALVFEAGAERSPLMEVAIDDACEHAARLDPRRAAPLPLPRDLAGSAAVALGVAVIALLHLPPKPPVEAPHARTIDAVPMTPDDVELFKEAARQLARHDQSPEVKAALDKFNGLIEDLANKRIDRTEAFRRMEEIERELLKGAEADAKSFEEALKQTADELKKSDLAKPLAESLEKKNMDQARKDLKSLAAALRDDKSNDKSGKSTKKADKASLERLRQALEKAAAKRKEALAAVNEKRNEVREQLLNKKSQPRDADAGAPNPEDERLLKKKERELERLDREAERQERMQRQLERLDRELGKAAEDLMKDLGMSAEDLEQAAEDVKRMQEEEMSDKEKEELRQRIEELREMLRQQGQGGKERMKRMLKFGKRARGGGGGKGDQGKGQQGQGDEGDEGDEGKDGQGKDGEGKDGQGKSEGGLTLGPGGKMIRLTMGQGQGQGQGEGPGMPGGPGQGQGQPGGDSSKGSPGKDWGTGHDPNVMGKRTDIKAGTEDVQEQGQDTRQGPTNSQVILGAADRGFKGAGYKRVFTDYHTRAEEQINKDQVPDGYRYYVNRYFQLIRPREE
jgi:hypothetical protein